MNINYLIELLSNRLSSLSLAKDQSFSAGDLEHINNLDNEILGVQDTLTKLKLLQTASQDMTTINSTLMESMRLKSNIITDGSIECLNEYDISSYATDPLHEQKIADILRSMCPMISPEIIDTYIDSEAIGSPITGQMILVSAQTYVVDVRLMMAIMELDSRFGTAGIAIRTLNPGNVGNTDDGNTKTYSSWEEGVDAVAKWLDRHRKTNIVEPLIIDADIPDKPDDFEIEPDPDPIPDPSPTPDPKPKPTIKPETNTTTTDQKVSLLRKKTKRRIF